MLEGYKVVKVVKFSLKGQREEVKYKSFNAFPRLLSEWPSLTYYTDMFTEVPEDTSPLCLFSEYRDAVSFLNSFELVPIYYATRTQVVECMSGNLSFYYAIFSCEYVPSDINIRAVSAEFPGSIFATKLRLLEMVWPVSHKPF